MKFWRWSKGRQGTGYEKFTLFFSHLLCCDVYILKIPKGVAIPKHTDPVPHGRHFRFNLTLRGSIYMEATGHVWRIASWYSFFRPDIVTHWAEAPVRDTYLLSVGWVRP